MRRLVISGLALGCALLAGGAAPAQEKARVNDFPTSARAEYVFACMSSNETNQIFLQKCSCAIDTIAARLDYDEYVQAQTILELQAAQSARIDEIYKSVGIVKSPLERYFRAEAAAQIKCF